MKKILSFIFLFVDLLSFAQKNEPLPVIRLHGQARDWENRHTIYYSMNGEPFSAKRSFVTDKNFRYQFDLSRTPYKQTTTGQIAFALDSTTKSNDEYSCTHKLDIGEAITLAKKLNKKQLDLQTDLAINFNCEQSVAYGAEFEAAKFPGTYLLKNKDTTWNIELQPDLLRYTSTLNPARNDFTNEEWGGWNYDAQKGILKLYITYYMNKQVGIMIEESKGRSFEVLQSEKGYSFKSKDGSTLVRVR